MRILYLTHALPKYAGDRTTVFIRALALAFKKSGHEITVLAPAHPELDLSYHKNLYQFSVYHYFPIKKCEVLGYGQGMSDGLHQNRLNFILGPFLIFFGIIAALRCTIKIKPHLIFANWGLPGGFIGAVVALLLRKKLIITFPGADVKIIMSNVIYTWFARFSSWVATALTTNSADLKMALIDQGLPKKKFHYVIYGASSDDLQPNMQAREYFRTKFSIAPHTLVIGSIGRFVDKKGFHYWFESIPQTLQLCPDYSLVFILFGTGENEAKLRSLITRYNLHDSVILPGPVAPEELLRVYNLFDIFVNPAIQKPVDGLNVVVVEAMACAKPIIATSVCGNDIVVHNRENGYLVPQMNPTALAEMTARLVKKPDLRDDMGKKSQHLFLQYFTWDKIVTRYCSLVSGDHS